MAEAALQLEASELTLATAARMMREAVRDRSYVGETGLGGDWTTLAQLRVELCHAKRYTDRRRNGEAASANRSAE